MPPRKKSEMELIHLILPIVGAFVLLFIVCCCGKKVKQVLHIPKEVVMGRYVLSAQLRASRNQARSHYELAPRSPTPEQISVDIESASCVHEELPKETPSTFTDDSEFSEITEITELMPEATPNAPHPRTRMSERDSGVYSLLSNSMGSVSTPSGRRQHHSSSSATSDSVHHARMRHCSSRSETSVVVSVRKASANNDEEFTIEDAGVCIIHQPKSSEIFAEPPLKAELSGQQNELDINATCNKLNQMQTLAVLAARSTQTMPSNDSPSALLNNLHVHATGNASVIHMEKGDEIEDSDKISNLPSKGCSYEDRIHSCLHTDECKKAANQNRVTFSDSKGVSIESQGSNESVFIS